MYISSFQPIFKVLTTAAATMASVKWSWADDKIFEGALVKFPDGTENRWEMIAGLLAGKTAMDVMVHYEVLVYDVDQIEAGLIELPSYPELTDEACPSSCMQPLPAAAAAAGGSKTKRKKGKPWTVEEHKLFLKGLEIYGQSDWRSISREMVKSRTPSQVASHAQKYFNRRNSDQTNRKRSSIHDITTHEENTSMNENSAAMNYCYANSSSPSAGVSSNYTTSARENFDMTNDAASVGVNHGIDNEATGVGGNIAAATDSYANYSNANAAAMNFYACNGVGVSNDTARVSETFYMSNDAASVGVNVNPCINNGATGVSENVAAMDGYANYSNANAATMNFYMSNDAAGVGVNVNPYINNDATVVGGDFHMNFDDTTSVGVNSYMINNDTRSGVGGDLHMEELWGFSEGDFGNALCQPLPESSNTTNPTSVSAPADVNVNDDANANVDDDAIVEMMEWPSDPWMDSVFYV